MIGTSSPATAARLFVGQAEKAGAVLPRPVMTAWHAISTTQPGITGDLAANTARAVADALVAGRDPAADPEVQRLAVQRVLDDNGVGPALELEMLRRFADTCASHADTIVAALRKPFDKAAA